MCALSRDRKANRESTPVGCSQAATPFPCLDLVGVWGMHAHVPGTFQATGSRFWTAVGHVGSGSLSQPVIIVLILRLSICSVEVHSQAGTSILATVHNEHFLVQWDAPDSSSIFPVPEPVLSVGAGTLSVCLPYLTGHVFAVIIFCVPLVSYTKPSLSTYSPVSLSKQLERTLQAWDHVTHLLTTCHL